MPRWLRKWLVHPVTLMLLLVLLLYIGFQIALGALQLGLILLLLLAATFVGLWLYGRVRRGFG